MPPQLNGPEQRISNPWVTGSTPVGGTMSTSKEQPYIVCGAGIYDAIKKALENYPSINKEEQMKEEIKKPLFKEGQFVRIKKREGEAEDYKYSFTDDMTAFEGDICVITDVVPNNMSGERKQKDDDAKYYLKGRDKEDDSPSGYSWASSMLEAVESPEPSYKVGQKVRIKKRVKDSYGTVRYTDDMNKHRGELHIIVNVKAHPGAYDNGDDFYIYELQKLGYCWTKSMLEPIEEEQKPKDEVDMMEGNSEHVDKAYLMYKLNRAMNWPKDAKFCYNQKVQISSVITSDTKGFVKQMINYAGNEGNIETVALHPGFKEYFYRLDEENGGDIWWPESLLTEIN